jgi:hypothetical protein
MVRFAHRPKRIEDVRDAARVVSYVLKERNRHDQIVFSANWGLDGLDDESIVYFVALGLFFDVHSDIPVLIILGQERPIDATNFENISRVPFKARNDSLSQFILVRRKSEKSGISTFTCLAQRPIRCHESPQAGHQLPSDSVLQGRSARRGHDFSATTRA